MKKVLLLLIAVTTTFAGFAQSGKNKMLDYIGETNDELMKKSKN